MSNARLSSSISLAVFLMLSPLRAFCADLWVPSYNEFSKMSRPHQVLVLQTMKEAVVALGISGEKSSGLKTQEVIIDGVAYPARCYMAGWKSQISEGLCILPHSSRDNFISVANMAGLKMEPCPYGKVHCHPFAFGFNKCVPISKQATSDCLKTAVSSESVLRRLNKIRSDPEKMGMLFQWYGGELTDFCTDSPIGQVQLCQDLEKKFLAMNLKLRGQAFQADLQEHEEERRQNLLAKEKKRLSEMPQITIHPVPSVARPKLPSVLNSTVGIAPYEFICRVIGLTEYGEGLQLRGRMVVDDTYPQGFHGHPLMKTAVRFAGLYRTKSDQELESLAEVDGFDWGGQNPFGCLGEKGVICDVRLTSNQEKNAAYDFSLTSQLYRTCKFQKVILDPKPCIESETFCVGKDERIQPNPYQVIRIKRQTENNKVEYFWCEGKTQNGPFFLAQNAVLREPSNNVNVNLNHSTDAIISKRLDEFGGMETIQSFHGTQTFSISRYQSKKSGFKNQVCELRAGDKKVQKAFAKMEPFDLRESTNSLPSQGE